jgi:hypothetical protein
MIVFQYGSNCLAERINSADRLDGAAKPMGKASTVDGFELEFDVYSSKNECAASDIVRCPGSGKIVWGILYDVPEPRLFGSRQDVKTLEQVEGRLYKAEKIIVDFSGTQVEAVTFTVRNPVAGLRTSPEYVSYILRGLREHGVPAEYIEQVRAKAITNNPEKEDEFRNL